ncbi:DUF87 domain-containing protein [Patescibacteria group bacterium]|nr:DUF87 domain-containing protein [Patescibacteria group bacterium]
MSEFFTKAPFKTPEEEIAYLRERIALREREIVSAGSDTAPEYKKIAHEELRQYATGAPEVILPPSRQISPALRVGFAKELESAKNKVEEVLHIAEEYGIKNVLSILDKVSDVFVFDAAHDALIAHIKAGKKVAEYKEGAPTWDVFHMTLFSVALPEVARDEERDVQFAKAISAMEQLFAGLSSMGKERRSPLHYSLEIAVSDKSDEIVFYIAIPSVYTDLFEKQILSLFPHALITEEKNDYNIFVEGGVSYVACAQTKRYPIYPIRTYDSFEHDPLRVLLNAFSKIEREGGGAALQFLVRPRAGNHQNTYEGIIKKVTGGMKIDKAISTASVWGELYHFTKDEFFTPKQKTEDRPAPEIPTEALELFRAKIERPIHEVVIRIAVSALDDARAHAILEDIEAAFNQFENTKGNRIVFEKMKGGANSKELHQFSFREFTDKYALPLSEKELATLVHIPQGSATLSPQFKQTQAISAPAPIDLPREGTLLGKNIYRNIETDVYITAEDRLRHFYIIGQTGTGKTTLMKNMIVQDIQNGSGVCMIDPHGSDVLDVLASIPPEREKDVIYFDPSYMDRVLGLNMLEYDPRYPEQKTFVINELFSIFQKLYGGNPESMGPIFEQYFRNATALVLEHPESGSTLLDVSRVMVDAEFRALKLSHSKNPVVNQFWREIATKAGGDAALENIVPYITSKFDVFTANDYMRPIIGQQASSFNFREVMDNKKILLVNLAKGRLGEINANLIGMIIVGKILMAALSRADSPGTAFSPFYLHIDEFQNITTNSIASILSEARKYKLGLTLAHQYIQQIDEKIRDAVFGNVGSMGVFRVGPEDAAFLENQFAPVFTKNDLLYIPNRHAYMRLLAHGTPTKPFDIGTLAPAAADPEKASRLMRESQMTHGRARGEIEQEILERYQQI